MNFLGIGGLEFLLIFAVGMFFLGPKRMAEGVRTGRKYYRELRRHRMELTSMVSEALDAEELKKDLEQTKKDMWDESASKSLKGIEKDLALDQDDLTIPELDITRSVPAERNSSRPKATQRGEGKIAGEEIPRLDLSAGPPTSATGTEGSNS